MLSFVALCSTLRETLAYLLKNKKISRKLADKVLEQNLCSLAKLLHVAKAVKRRSDENDYNKKPEKKIAAMEEQKDVLGKHETSEEQKEASEDDEPAIT